MAVAHIPMWRSTKTRAVMALLDNDAGLTNAAGLPGVVPLRDSVKLTRSA
jgi:hypothetical protein